jgi:hypothetical protein
MSYDVFTHCFVLRTKYVFESFFFRVEVILSNRNFEKNFYLIKLLQPI